MQNTFSQSGNDSKWFLKQFIFQNSYVALETPSRPPPLHGKCHLKFPFWFFDYLPYLEQFIFLPKPWCSIYGENYHWSIFESFWKESMINQLSNLINRTRSAAKISQFFLYLLAPHKTPCFQKYWQIVGIKAKLFLLIAKEVSPWRRAR